MALTRRSVLWASLAALTACRPERRAPVAAAPSSRAPSPSPAPPPPATFGPRLVEVLKVYTRAAPDHPRGPVYAGAVGLATVDGVTTAHEAVGEALRYGPGPVELPPERRVPMRPDSVFDVASLTKTVTATLVLQQVDRGRIALDEPVVRYLPEFGKPGVTVAMLLAHTSGLPDGITVGSRAAVLALPLVGVPGKLYRYTDAGFLVLGYLLQKVTGQPLDALVRELGAALGWQATGFNPRTWLTARERLVATDHKRERGTVHDGNAHALGGVAGHAGLFSTAADLAALGQMLLNGGEYRGTRVLAEATVRRMLSNANPGVPAVPNPDHGPTWSSANGLGVRLDQPWFMGKLSGPATFGHTGFTGTSIVVDPRRRAVLVLLTNRAHPDWRRANPDPARVAVANAFAAAV